MGNDVEDLQSGEVFATISKLRKWSLSVLGKLKEGTSNEIKDIRSEYVKKIQDFTDKNLHLDVSLRVLADHVNLHPTHLSKIYKIETGEGISDYISRLRMDRACHKLVTTTKKCTKSAWRLVIWTQLILSKCSNASLALRRRNTETSTNNITENRSF